MGRSLQVLSLCTAVLAGVLGYIVLDILRTPVQFSISTEQLVRSAGYPCERHEVETKDGYLLTVFRIPQGKGDKSTGPRPAFFLQHGIMGCSDNWVLLGPERALGFLLADRGYDVWLGNARGNSYSSKHVRFDPALHSQYWDFRVDQKKAMTDMNTLDYFKWCPEVPRPKCGAYDEYDFCVNVGNLIDYYRVPLSTFNHVDFVFGWSAKDLVYKRIFEIIDKRPQVMEQKAKCIQV